MRISSAGVGTSIGDPEQCQLDTFFYQIRKNVCNLYNFAYTDSPMKNEIL